MWQHISGYWKQNVMSAACESKVEDHLGLDRLLLTAVTWGNIANNTAGCNIKPVVCGCAWTPTGSLLTCCYSWEVQRVHGSKMMGTSPSCERGEARLGMVVSVMNSTVRLHVSSQCTRIWKFSSLIISSSHTAAFYMESMKKYCSSFDLLVYILHRCIPLVTMVTNRSRITHRKDVLMKVSLKLKRKIITNYLVINSGWFLSFPATNIKSFPYAKVINECIEG